MLDTKAVHIDAGDTAHREVECDGLGGDFDTHCIALERGEKIPLQENYQRCLSCWTGANLSSNLG